MAASISSSSSRQTPSALRPSALSGWRATKRSSRRRAARGGPLRDTRARARALRWRRDRRRWRSLRDRAASSACTVSSVRPPRADSVLMTRRRLLAAVTHQLGDERRHLRLGHLVDDERDRLIDFVGRRRARRAARARCGRAAPRDRGAARASASALARSDEQAERARLDRVGRVARAQPLERADHARAADAREQVIGPTAPPLVIRGKRGDQLAEPRRDRRRGRAGPAGRGRRRSGRRRRALATREQTTSRKGARHREISVGSGSVHRTPGAVGCCHIHYVIRIVTTRQYLVR